MKSSVVFLVVGLAPAWAFGASTALRPASPPVPPADADAPLLVRDVAPAWRDSLPRNFRTTSDPLPAETATKPATTGLSELHASGSAEFTEKSLKLMLAKLTGRVTVFDLRQEDHIFVNGEPVSWYATNNWANVGKSHDAIVAGESARVGACKIGATLEIADDKGPKSAAAHPVEHVTVARVQSEQAVVAGAGAAYVRLTVSDHARPLDDEVDRFIRAVRALPADSWVHFHCRAGKGRTTTFLALYDMLRNAPRVPLADIVDRQSLLIGDYNLLAKEADAGWKTGLTQDRAEFVRAFYAYACVNPGGRPQLWSEWLKSGNPPAR